MINAIAILAASLSPADRPRIEDDDAVLVERHRGGDREAFALIYRAHVDAVYRRLGRILGPIPEREDLTQDVFLALHRTLPGFRGDAKLSTLLHRIAINRACEHLRVQQRRPATAMDTAFFDALVDRAASPEQRAAEREALARVFACLGKIKPKKRVAFVLRVVDGLSFEEIAELVDATPEAVAKRVQHAQAELDALIARADRRAS
ncbi:MAG: RNA polymerase sigma factor [Myxococcales bacterium]|nr:RNA polymerase sigma factor [Myxococcales bacterium]